MKKSTIAILFTVLALMVAACGGGSDGDGGTAATEAPSGAGSGGDAANGEKVFAGTCSACHGADAMGIDGLGKQLVESEFVASQSDSELFTLITTGRPSSDPLNTTGVDMPPKGGNPSLNDAAIADLVAYLRSLA